MLKAINFNGNALHTSGHATDHHPVYDSVKARRYVCDVLHEQGGSTHGRDASA